MKEFCLLFSRALTISFHPPLLATRSTLSTSHADVCEARHFRHEGVHLPLVEKKNSINLISRQASSPLCCSISPQRTLLPQGAGTESTNTATLRMSRFRRWVGTHRPAFIGVAARWDQRGHKETLPEHAWSTMGRPMATPRHGAQASASERLAPDNPFLEHKWLDEHGGPQMSLDEASKVLGSHSELLGRVGVILRGACFVLSATKATPEDVAFIKEYIAQASALWEAMQVSNPLESLGAAAFPFHGRHVLMSAVARREFNDRLREWSVEVRLIDMTCWMNPETLLVVAGESGSGKTFNALMLHDKDYFVLYLTLREMRDAGWNEDDVREGMLKGEITEEDRHKLLRGALRRAAEAFVPEKTRLAFKIKPAVARPKGFVLLVDDVGAAPQLLRTLCALLLNSGRARRLNSLGFLDDYPLRVVAVGARVDAFDVQPGSLPQTYTLVHMPSTPTLWHVIVASAAQRAESSCNESSLSEALRRMAAYRPAADLATNARLAVLIAMHTQKAAEALAVADGRIQRQQLMDQVLRAAAVEFRSLGALSTMDRGSLSAALSHAVRLVMTHATSAGQPDTLGLEMTRSLCTTLGVLTDHAVPKTWDCRYVLLRDVALMAPTNASGRCCRFQMSPAQLTLMHMMYGFNVPPAAGGGEFERLVARYLELVLIACRGLPVEELLERIGMQGGPTTAQPALGMLEYRGVAVVRTPTLSPKTPSETKEAILKELASRVREGHAVVVVNGDQSPFADVIVMIPERLLVLVHCKAFATDMPWTRFSAYVALHAMGVVDRWTLLADEVRRLSLTEAQTAHPQICPATTNAVPRVQIFEALVQRTSREVVDTVHVTIPAGDLVAQLSMLVGGGAAVPVRHCLLTTKPALRELESKALQMHATGTTMWPLQPRAEERDPAAVGTQSECMNLFRFETKHPQNAEE